MARGLHRHRRIRLDNLQQTRLDTRAAKAPGKVKARACRDERMLAVLKKGKTAAGWAPAVQSWLSKRVGKPASKISDADIKAILA